MKKNLIFLFSIVLFFTTNIQAEIVNLQKDEKQFGEWKVFCETDLMMSLTHCRIGSKFFDEASAITIEPNNTLFNQFFITTPKIRLGSFLQIRVDQNDLIFSEIVKAKNFGLIDIKDEDKKLLFNQMKKGSFLFLRFNIANSDKEITAKISLADFRNALSYYKERVSK